MPRHRSSHRDMADVNVYTARRLNDMARSMEDLARACTEDSENGQKLTREDSVAAMEMAAAMVCGECGRCALPRGEGQNDSYYPYYLLRTFEQKGMVEEADMPRQFADACRRKDEYLMELNRNLGRATMNLDWKNRFLESRDAVMIQFRELAVMLEEFAHQMEAAVDITANHEEAVRREFRRHKINVENLLLLEYEDRQKEAYITLKTMDGSCVTAKEACVWLGHAMGERIWQVARDSRNIVSRQSGTLHFTEEGVYQMLCGTARLTKDGEAVSGDNYTYVQKDGQEIIMSLSDGMGSGQTASDESRRVIELAGQLIEAGFSARAALKLVNTILLLTGTEQHPATMDLCCVDLHSGVLEAMKLGAVATYILGEDGVELLEAPEVPLGVVGSIEPVLLSKKLWEDNRIVMVSDGVLDALPGEDKELILREYLEGMPRKSPQDMAERILEFACSYIQAPKDDMTVLTAGIWKRRR